MIAMRVRGETRCTEQRAPLTPADAARLVAAGIPLTVEDAPRRCFPTASYAAAGCTIAEEGSWADASPDEIVLGLKELPDAPKELRAPHVFFGHAYRGQPGARDLLRRFRAGGGHLLDLEFLVDSTGRRVATFGYWAGYVGAALALLYARDRLVVPLRRTTRDDLDAELSGKAAADPAVLVIGALGRAGRGACDAVVTSGLEPTRWDIEQTRVLDRPALLAHDVLIHAVGVTQPGEPLLRPGDLGDVGSRLRLIADVTCDVGTPFDLLRLHDRTTSWDDPVLALSAGGEVIAIDNLPSLLPVEASTTFSAALLPHLMELSRSPRPSAVWQHARGAFDRACEAAELDEELLYG